MKHDWEYKKLVDVCGVQYGYAFDSTLFNEDKDGLPLVRIRDVVRGFSETYFRGAFSNDYVVRYGDYLIGMDGEFNIAQWKSEDALLNQRVCKVFAIDNKQAEMRFLYYFLTRQLKEIEDETPFVTVKHLSAKRINQIIAPIPPLPIQEQIVAELDKVSEIIEKKKQQVKELDNLAQSIFYDMFGDPVENEKGWEVRPLAENVEEMFLGPFGSALKVDSYVEKKDAFCMVYEQKHAIKAKMDFEDTHYITEEKYLSLQRFAVREGDFIMSCRGTIGKVYQLPKGAPLGIIHPSLMKIRIKNSYNSIFFKDLLIKVVSNENTNGNCVQMAITAKELGRKNIILPPLPLQQSFAQKVEAIEKQKELITASIKEAQMLFDARMDYWFGE